MRVISWLSLLLLAQAPDELVRRGVEQFHYGQYAAARDTLSKAVEQFPGNPHAATFLALAQAATGGCPFAIASLSAQFNTGDDADLRRLAGIGLMQCYLAENRFDVWLALLGTGKSVEIRCSFHRRARIV